MYSCNFYPYEGGGLYGKENIEVGTGIWMICVLNDERNVWELR